MLPDRDRQTLSAIEAELLASDPTLADVFSGRDMRQARRWSLLLVLSDITAVVMLVVGLFARDAALVLWGTVAAGGLVAWHIARSESTRKATADDSEPPLTSLR
ncbi:DUF3040 domain-containing protein [Amycolatopsis sp. NPDC088138]|uniref:DUF3040 domain-containing protein n=1 Tax=Amycolatopsis sp. NPDC088138 TaxID=3363938 RepID=UPI00380A1710